MAVARLTTTSCPATAVANASRSNRLTCTGVAPASWTCLAFWAVRTTPVTSAPVVSSRATVRRPTTPVAPVTKIFMSVSSSMVVTFMTGRGRNVTAPTCHTRQREIVRFVTPQKEAPS